VWRVEPIILFLLTFMKFQVIPLLFHISICFDHLHDPFYIVGIVNVFVIIHTPYSKSHHEVLICHVNHISLIQRIRVLNLNSTYLWVPPTDQVNELVYGKGHNNRDYNCSTDEATRRTNVCFALNCKVRHGYTEDVMLIKE
jgi:hypothetical protein